MKMVKLAGLSLCAAVAALGIDLAVGVTSASAQTQLTLEQVLDAVRKERSAASAENQERERRFLAERNNQQAELNRVRSQVAAAAAESTRLEGVMEANQAELDRLAALLHAANAAYHGADAPEMVLPARPQAAKKGLPPQ